MTGRDDQGRDAPVRQAHAVLLAMATQLAAELHALQEAAAHLEAAQASTVEYGRLQVQFAAWRARLAAMRDQMRSTADVYEVHEASEDAAS